MRAFLKLHCVQKYPALSIGPPKSYFLHGKIQYEGQSAGNMAICLGSSETTREAYILKNNLFKLWFIGFLEGKGSFLINKNGKLEFKIVHTSTEASVLFYIKKELGFGVVRIQDKVKNNHCFKVNDEKGLFKLIFILNGNLFLDTKQIEFKLWLDAYNQKYRTTLVFFNNNNKPDLSNWWLSGFTDAVGSFTCIIKDIPDKSGGFTVKLSYTLSQDGNYSQMKYLAEILKGKLHYNNGIYETTVNTTKLSKVIDYLNIHSLKTNKSIVYLNIRKIYFLIKGNKSLTNGDIKLLTRYKNNLNRLASKIS
nr:hypothetical protein [Valsa mali var. pyri (nom. inval.)]